MGSGCENFRWEISEVYLHEPEAISFLIVSIGGVLKKLS